MFFKSRRAIYPSTKLPFPQIRALFIAHDNHAPFIVQVIHTSSRTGAGPGVELHSRSLEVPRLAVWHNAATFWFYPTLGNSRTATRKQWTGIGRIESPEWSVRPVSEGPSDYPQHSPCGGTHSVFLIVSFQWRSDNNPEVSFRWTADKRRRGCTNRQQRTDPRSCELT